MDLGDQKPSHLLRKMRTLSNGNISDETIKLLWLRLLPPSVTSVLAVTEDIDVNKMSQIADKILINSTRTEVSAVNGNKSGDDTMSCILAQLAEMQLELNAIQQGQKNYRRSTQSYSNRRHFLPQSSSRERRHFCFYHGRFKKYAQKCVQPCDWKQDLNSRKQGN